MNTFNTRKIEKEELILQFLKDEGFSTAKILGELLGLKRTATFQTLKRLERNEILQEVKTTDEIGKGCPSLWGLTVNGAFLATDDGPWNPFDLNRVSEITMKHELTVQHIRVQAYGLGWVQWIGGRTLRRMTNKDRLTWLQIPDGFAISPKKRKVALEVERTVKTHKRYSVIFSNYCQMLLDGTVQEIIYICPKKVTPRLSRYFLNIESIFINGEFRPLNDSFRKRFHFISYDEWEDFAQNI